MRLKSLFTLLSLALIALIIWWFQLVDDRAADLLSIDDERFIDAYMRDFKLTAMNADGAPGYTLEAREFNHFNDSDAADLVQPVMHLLHTDGDWQFSAEQGQINDAQNQITLSNNVIVQQVLDNGATSGVRLHTEQLEIDTNRQLASTALVTHIVYKNLKLRSRGMRLDNTTGQLELLAEVTGVYDRP